MTGIDRPGFVESWCVGSTRLTTVVEEEHVGVPVGLFYPEATTVDVAAADWLPPGAAAGGDIAMRVQAFVVERPVLTMLVDPCVGNHKQRTLPFWNDLDHPWLERLAAAGFTPDDIDLVVHTHLHEDHLGWDTHLVDGEWVPTFTNARHVYVGEELSWAELDERRVGHDPFADSIAPILEAGLAWEVGPDAELAPGVRLVPTAGHTPGHVSIEIDTGADPLVVSGDLLHHQFQFTNPAIAEVADWDVARARTTRVDAFAWWARSGAVVAGTHFPIAPVGVVSEHGEGWRFDPIAADESFDRIAADENG